MRFICYICMSVLLECLLVVNLLVVALKGPYVGTVIKYQTDYKCNLLSPVCVLVRQVYHSLLLICLIFYLSLLLHYWLGDRKDIQPVKSIACNSKKLTFGAILTVT